MYCPRCGQEQLSTDLRFCSRCGLNLQAVPHLLTTGGLLPVVGDAPGEITPRRRGMRLGAKVLFGSLVSLPLTIALSAMIDNPFPLLLFVVLFLCGVFRMLYARLFEEGSRSAAQIAALPVYQPPAHRLQRGPTTGEIVEQPPSVTEHTTRFLDQ